MKKVSQYIKTAKTYQLETSVHDTGIGLYMTNLRQSMEIDKFKKLIDDDVKILNRIVKKWLKKEEFASLLGKYKIGEPKYTHYFSSNAIGLFLYHGTNQKQWKDNRDKLLKFVDEF